MKRKDNFKQDLSLKRYNSLYKFPNLKWFCPVCKIQFHDSFLARHNLNCNNKNFKRI